MNQQHRTVEAIRTLVRDAESAVLAILKQLQESTGMNVDSLSAEHFDVTVFGDENARRALTRVTIDLRL